MCNIVANIDQLGEADFSTETALYLNFSKFSIECSIWKRSWCKEYLFFVVNPFGPDGRFIGPTSNSVPVDGLIFRQSVEGVLLADSFNIQWHFIINEEGNVCLSVNTS